mmetsp:Transcript_119114/g.231782  ORF Transcript_119114/g.231782 Transcript_119114/m.231782 type:complete len:81 (-) Transcript_119114:267-509(-)
MANEGRRKSFGYGLSSVRRRLLVERFVELRPTLDGVFLGRSGPRLPKFRSVSSLSLDACGDCKGAGASFRKVVSLFLFPR